MSLKSLFTGRVNAKMSNELLIQRYAVKKESHILACLYDNCERDLYHFLLSLTDPELAQELAQRTWLRVIEKAHLYKSSGSFKAWLFTIARRCLIDEFRKQGRLQTLFEEAPSATESVDASASLTEVELNTYHSSPASLSQQFHVVLNRLPFVQKEAFCLQQEGFSLIDIAQLTSCEVETVKSRVRYAKNTIKKHLEKYRD